LIGTFCSTPAKSPPAGLASSIVLLVDVSPQRSSKSNTFPNGSFTVATKPFDTGAGDEMNFSFSSSRRRCIARTSSTR
jgi:hypothetical protein